MRKQKIALIVLIVLLLMNLTAMAFLWLSREERGNRRGDGRQRTEVSEFLKEELQLSAGQQQAFREQRQAFFEKSRELRQQIRAARRDFYQHVTLANEVEAERYAARIADLQQQLEMNTFYHFRDLRQQLSPEQQAKFDEVMQEMLKARWADTPRRDKAGRGER